MPNAAITMPMAIVKPPSSGIAITPTPPATMAPASSICPRRPRRSRALANEPIAHAAVVPISGMAAARIGQPRPTCSPSGTKPSAPVKAIPAEAQRIAIARPERVRGKTGSGERHSESRNPIAGTTAKRGSSSSVATVAPSSSGPSGWMRAPGSAGRIDGSRSPR